MARPDKAAAVAELADGFRSSTAVLLTEYRGLTVAQLKELRRALGEHVTYSVVKNTLTKIAAREASVEGLDHLLAGPSALAFVSGDPVEAAKGLRDFSKVHPLLVIKGGVMDGKSLTPDEIKKLADLESREVLLAKLAGAMKASLSGAVSLFAAPLSQTARLIEALRAKVEQDSPAPVAETPEAPVAEAPVEAEAAVETEAPVESAEAPASAEAEAPSETQPPPEQSEAPAVAEGGSTPEAANPEAAHAESTEA